LEIRRALLQEKMVDAVLYIVRDVERIVSIVEQLCASHPRVLFLIASAFVRFGHDAYAMRTHAVGGSLEEMLTQMAEEARTVRAAVSV
jgi:hypothetical protein